MSSAKKLSIILISVISSLLICFTVRWVFEPGDRPFEILFHRSFIQYLTVYVSALVTTLLGQRLWIYMCAKRSFQMVQKDKQLWTIPNLVFGEEPDTIRQELIENGGEGVFLYVDELARAWKDKIRKAYGSINSLVFCLPGLGLFGTMIGMSNSLFSAFGQGNADPEAAQQFVAGLSTALDTTILAMACLLIIGGLSWLLNHLEEELIDRRVGFVRKALRKKLPFESPASLPTAGANNHTRLEKCAFRAELRTLTVEILEEAMSKFEQKLHDMAESYRVNLERVVNDIFSKQRAHEQTLVDNIASNLNTSVKHIGVLIERHNNHAAKAVVSRLKRFTGILEKRIPSELVIRYERNGEAKLEGHDDV
jgi:biopolymer transport protein ExbB/TolQ